MSRLLDNIKSDYFKAINDLKPKKAAKAIMVYVESEDDIPFWWGVFKKYAPHHHFEFSFPSYSLARGKNEVLKMQAGEFLLLCVDSDYDYLLQNATEVSKCINHNPYIFQTYTYSIENYKCYAESLKGVCILSCLNDEEVFDLVGFLKLYSNIIYELFLCSYYFEKQGNNSFTRDDFSKTIKLENVNVKEQGKQAINALINSVNEKLSLLKKKTPLLDCVVSELKMLGVNEDNTYLFVKGHVIYDNVVLMVLKPLYRLLKSKKLEEFKTATVDKSIRINKTKQYNAQITDIEYALRMNTDYYSCFLMKKIEQDVKIYLKNERSMG